MLTPEQLTRLREVCWIAIKNANRLQKMPNSVLLPSLGDIYKDNGEKSTAALADVDAEIAKLKGTS